MNLPEKAKDLASLVIASALAVGTVNGVGTLVPNEYDPFGGIYNRPCAAFCTNAVRKIALEEQEKLLHKAYEKAQDVLNYIK